MKRFDCVCAVLLAASAISAADTPELQLNENNIKEIVAAMTLDEKARLVTGRNDYTFGGYDNPEEFVRFIKPSVSGYTQGVPRLGIPPTALADGPAGAVVVTREDNDKSYYATGFPSGIALASSWDGALVEEVGRAMGNEILEYGCDVILAPGMNIMRSPLCGRNYEYYSEDPVLTGRIAASFVNGIQSNGVGTSLKHYAVNSQETNRTEVDEIVDQRSLREIYLKGFEIAVKEASPWTVMASYNRLNGPYTQENYELLTTILRDEWGFDGIVMTDWIQQRNTAAQIHAGIDNLQPGYEVQIRDIKEMIADGRLSVADLDKACERMLKYIVKTPHFRRYKYSDNPDLEAHAAVCRRAGAESMVLLKNSCGTLPLSDSLDVALLGLHSYDFMAGGTGSGNVVKPYVVNLAQGLCNAGFSVKKGPDDLYKSYKEYWDARNRCNRDPEQRWYTAPPVQEPALDHAAVENLAKTSDIAIVTIGRQAGEGGDRPIEGGFNLTDEERGLIDDVCSSFHARGKKVIVVLNVGGPVETASWRGLPDAILLAWQPGQEGGNSVADVLTGKVNPSGKLPATFPISIVDVPSTLNYPTGYSVSGRSRDGRRKNIDYTLHEEGIDIGYRYFCTSGQEVAYPFGYGLSYTDFTYSSPVIKKKADGGFYAFVKVTNSGKTAGKESVQLYVTAPDGKLAKPAVELKAFAKTRLLQPGESETLCMSVSPYDLASFDSEIQSWVTDKGHYKVLFGASAEDVRCTADFTVRDASAWPVNDVLRPKKN